MKKGRATRPHGEFAIEGIDYHVRARIVLMIAAGLT